MVQVRLWLMVAMVLAATVACRPEATPTPAASPTATATPTASATPTAGPSPTATPTTARPAQGSAYRNETYGFSLEVPPGWVRTEAGSNPLLLLQGPQGLPLVFVSLVQTGRDTSLEERVADYIRELRGDLSDFQVSSQGDVRLADGTGAYRIDFTYTQQGAAIRGMAVLVAQGTRTFRIEGLSQPEDFQRNLTTIQDLVLSFRAFEARPFGVDLREALVVPASSPRTLDPHLSDDATTHQFIVLLFSGLVRLDKELQVQPDLAASWTVSGDGTVYTFKLRPDARFHNGRRVTAQDVKFSIERAADPATGSHTASIYLNDIVGVADKLAGRATEVRGVRVVDEGTVEVRIDAPKAYFLAKLTYPTAYVVDRENVAQGSTWYTTPNGTGPFKLVTLQPGRVFIAERNEGFYRQPPQLRYVVLQLAASIASQAYEEGLVDVAPVGVSQLERLRDPTNPISAELREYPQLSIHYTGFNSTVPPFDDPDVRRAFAMAVDKERLNEVVFLGSVEVAAGFLPPGIPGFDPALEGIAYDPQAARALLESKYPDPAQVPPIIYTTSGLGGAVGPVEGALIQMWRDNLGVQVQVRQIDPSVYFDELRRAPDHLFSYGWIADYPDPENILDVLFHSGQVNNVGGFSDAEVDRLLEEARTEASVERRLQLYRDVERRLVRQAAAIPLFYDREYVLVKPWVQGLEVTAQGLYTFETARLEGKP